MLQENIALRHAEPSAEPANIQDWSKAYRNRDNATFFAMVRNDLDQLDETALGLTEGRSFKRGLRAAIGLLGEYGLVGYTIRLAQALIRFDRQPSYWSHSFLFHSAVPTAPQQIRARNTEAPIIWESTIDFTGPVPQLHMVNGVSPRYLRDYNRTRFDLLSHHCVPNVGAVVFALSEEEVNRLLQRATDPNVDALRYDFSGLIGTWFAYIMNRQNEMNPLGAGYAVYCSAYCQLAYDAISLDLATGAHARNTSPEHIWQAGKWFSEVYSRLGFPVRVYSCIRDPYCQMIPVQEKVSMSLDQAMARLRGLR